MHQSREAKLCCGNLKISKAYKNKVLYVIHATYPLRVNSSSVLKHLHSKIPVGGTAPPYLEHCRSHSRKKRGRGMCQFLIFLLGHSHLLAKAGHIARLYLKGRNV